MQIRLLYAMRILYNLLPSSSSWVAVFALCFYSFSAGIIAYLPPLLRNNARDLLLRDGQQNGNFNKFMMGALSALRVLL